MFDGQGLRRRRRSSGRRGPDMHQVVVAASREHVGLHHGADSADAAVLLCPCRSIEYP